MKFTILFQTPSADEQLFDESRNFSQESNHKAKQVFEKFVEFNEILKVEFDTEAQTARVLPTS